MDGLTAVLNYVKCKNQDNRFEAYKANEGLVVRIALKFKGTYETDDLISLARLYFFECLEYFDPERAKFTTYATYYISGKIKNYLRDNKEFITIPTWRHDLISKHPKAEVRLKHKLGRTPTKPELAESLNITVSALATIEGDIRNPIKMASIDSLYEESRDFERRNRKFWANIDGNATTSVSMDEIDFENQEIINHVMEVVTSTESIAIIARKLNCPYHVARHLKSKLQ